MDWRDRRIFVAFGAAAAAGLVFGMLLGVLGGGDGDGSPSGAVEQSQPTQTTPSEPGEPTSTASSRPTINSTDYPEDDFGFLRDVKREDGRTVLVFDRAILLTGDAARREAEKRHITLDNDYLITNDSRRLRDRVVAASVTATGSQILTGHPASTAVEPQVVYDYVRSQREPPLPVYLRYDRTTGQVIKIEEVYFP